MWLRRDSEPADRSRPSNFYIFGISPTISEKLNDGCNNRTSFNSWMFSVTGIANTDPLMVMNDGEVQ